jgi:hypothetical protein
MFDADFAIFPKPDTPSYDYDHKNLIWVPRRLLSSTSWNESDQALKKNEHRIPCLFLPCNSHSDKVILYFHGNSEDIGNCEYFFFAVRDAWKVLFSLFSAM